MKYNIFQGNSLLNKRVAASLGYNVKECEHYGVMPDFTRDMYFQAFFYLSKRFGQAKVYDDLRQGGVWNFEVDEYHIRIVLNSSWVSFIMYGNAKHKYLQHQTPYRVRMNRRIKNNPRYIPIFSDKTTELHENIMRQQWQIFCKQEGITDEWTQEEVDKKQMKWIDFLGVYNEKLLNVDFDEMNRKYGRDYQNSQTRKALRVLDKFIKNLLSPIWIRDCAFNLKGRCDDELEQYDSNIKITFLKD